MFRQAYSNDPASGGKAKPRPFGEHGAQDSNDPASGGKAKPRPACPWGCTNSNDPASGGKAKRTKAASTASIYSNDPASGGKAKPLCCCHQDRADSNDPASGGKAKLRRQGIVLGVILTTRPPGGRQKAMLPIGAVATVPESLPGLTGNRPKGRLLATDYSEHSNAEYRLRLTAGHPR